MLLDLSHLKEPCLSCALEQDRSTSAALMDCHHHHSHTHSLKVRAVAGGKENNNEEHDAHKHIQPLHWHAQASLQLPDAGCSPPATDLSARERCLARPEQRRWLQESQAPAWLLAPAQPADAHTHTYVAKVSMPNCTVDLMLAHMPQQAAFSTYAHHAPAASLFALHRCHKWRLQMLSP